MNIYEKGKIYRLFDRTTGEEYIGSTTKKTLNIRKSYHKHDYKRYNEGRHNYVSSYEIIKNDNYDIELLENVNCQTREELGNRERHYILISRQGGRNVNKKIPKLNL